MIEFALGGVVIGGFLGILLAVLPLNIFPGRWGPWLLAVAMLLAFAPFASAQHVVYPQCVTPVQVQTHYNAPAVAQYHTNSPVIALFLDSYYLSQNPVPSIASRAEAAPSACEKRTADLEAKVERLTLAVLAQQQPPAVAPQPLPTVAPPPLAAPRTQLAPPPGASPFLANCVACHDSSVAAAKGGGHAFFLDGKERPLSCDEAVSIYEALEDGSMPKGRKLDDQTIADINARVRELRRAGKAAAGK